LIGKDMRVSGGQIPPKSPQKSKLAAVIVRCYSRQFTPNVKMPLFMILDLAWGFPQEKRWDWAQFQLLAGWPRRGDLGRLGEPSAKKYE